MRKRPKVLILDDESSVREALKLLLKEAVKSINVKEASSVEQARLMNKVSGPFDLYLVDLVLPGIHGTCFIDDLLNSQRQRVLILSAFVDDNVYWMCDHMGLSKEQILSKPFDESGFQTKVQEMLGLQSDAVVGGEK